MINVKEYIPNGKQLATLTLIGMGIYGTNAYMTSDEILEIKNQALSAKIEKCEINEDELVEQLDKGNEFMRKVGPQLEEYSKFS